jgi:hypothetical protein
MIRLLIACYLPLLAVSGAEFAVSPEGDDRNSGTLTQPFRSLERARDAARQHHAGSPSDAVYIRLSAGVHLRTSSLDLDERDSRTAWCAQGKDRPILSGGVRLARNDFRRTDNAAVLDRIIDPTARVKVWETDLRRQGVSEWGDNRRHGFLIDSAMRGTPPSQLYINGGRQHLARWPNTDEHLPQYLPEFVSDQVGVVGRIPKDGILDAGPTAKDADWTTRGPVFRYAFERADRWTQAEDAWLDGIFTNSWEWSYNQILRIDAKERTIALRYGEASGMANIYSGDFFFAENLLEELDRPGEYWVDQSRGILYLVPPPEFDTAESEIVVATLATPMIRIAKGAKDLLLRGLILEYGRSLGIQAQDSARIRIEDCLVRGFANGGINLDGSGHVVSSCRLTGIGGTSISMSGGDLLALTPGENTVESCLITDGSWYHRVYNPAVMLAGVGNRLQRCRIANMPHCGILLFGNDHLVEGNDIGEMCQEFDDMGAIYINSGDKPLERGHVLRRNFIHDIGQSRMANGIYPDNGTMGILIEDNVFARIGTGQKTGKEKKTKPAKAIYINSGAHIIVRHNLFIDCAYPLWLSAYSGKVFHDRQKKSWEEFFQKHPLNLLPHRQRYPELRQFWQEERRYPTTNIFEGNVLWNPSNPLGSLKNYKGLDGLPLQMIDGTVTEYPGLTRKGNWIADTDPGVVDAAKDDFSLRSNAEAFKRVSGFPRLRMKDIGPVPTFKNTLVSP